MLKIFIIIGGIWKLFIQIGGIGMKLEIVHLSDFHVKDLFNFKSLTEKMLDSIYFEDDDVLNKIVICITGDLTYSAMRKQFDYFNAFLEELKEKLVERGKEVVYYIVPGNHDIHLEDDSSRRPIISNSLEKGNIEYLVKEDIDKLKEFFRFSSKFAIFCNDKFIDIHCFDLDGLTIQFNLLNTVIFSSLRKEDKDHHYIPIESLNNMTNDADYVVTLMHHSLEWFSEKCRDKVENVLVHSSFHLYGHQHEEDIEKTKKTLGFRNGEINVIDDIESMYSINLLDLNDSHLEHYEVKYDETEEKFVRKEKDKKIFVLQKRKLHHNKNHGKIVELSKIETMFGDFPLENIFVMPLLIPKEEDEKSVKNIIELKNEIENSICCIDGITSSGKSTLLKKLFFEFLNTDKYILYASELNVTNNFEKNLRNLFMDNYPDLSYDAFSQAPKKEKILLVDNVNSSMESKHKFFLKECQKYFGTIVFINENFYENRSQFVQYIASSIKSFRIQPFTLQQRKLLIEKYAHHYGDLTSVELINKCIESIIIDETFFDMTIPETLTTIIIKVIKDKLYQERQTHDSFNSVFESSIIEAIKKCNENLVDETITNIREIAYYMFCKSSHECYKVNENEMFEIHEKCKEIWGLRIDFRDLIDIIINSKIMRKKDDYYIFYKNSYYSYFVAKNILEKRNNDDDIQQDLEKLMDNVIFGNYSDILLYIAYFFNSAIFFENIITAVLSKIKDWTELSFDENNHYILNRILREGTNIPDTYESKNEFAKRIDDGERKKIKKISNSSDEERYKKKEYEGEINEVLKIAKYLEILSKGINGYPGKIKKELRTKMVHIVQKSIYKTIFKTFDFSVDEYDELYRLLYEKLFEKNPQASKLDFEKFITNFLYDTMTTFSLNLISNFARLFVSKNSIKIIDDIRDVNTDGKPIFNNILFKIISYERYGQEEKFVQYLLDHYDDIKNADYKRLLRRVFNLFIITSDISNSNLDRCCSKLHLRKDKILSLTYNCSLIVSKKVN